MSGVTLTARMVEQGDGSMEVLVGDGTLDDRAVRVGVVNGGDGMFDAAGQLLERHGWAPVGDVFVWEEPASWQRVVAAGGPLFAFVAAVVKR